MKKYGLCIILALFILLLVGCSDSPQDKESDVCLLPEGRIIKVWSRSWAQLKNDPYWGSTDGELAQEISDYIRNLYLVEYYGSYPIAAEVFLGFTYEDQPGVVMFLHRDLQGTVYLKTYGADVFYGNVRQKCYRLNRMESEYLWSLIIQMLENS